MNELSRQQLCATLQVSESTVMRLEAQGLPFTRRGDRRKFYDLAQVKRWLRARQPARPPLPSPEVIEAMRRFGEYVEAELAKGGTQR